MLAGRGGDACEGRAFVSCGGDLGEGCFDGEAGWRQGKLREVRPVARGRRLKNLRTCWSKELGGERRQGLEKDVVS